MYKQGQYVSIEEEVCNALGQFTTLKQLPNTEQW